MERIIKTLEEWKRDLECRIERTHEEIKLDEETIKKKRNKILKFGEEIAELQSAIEKLKKKEGE